MTDEELPHHERRTLLPIGDPRNPIKESPVMLTTEQFIRRFKIVETPLISLPLDLSQATPGASLEGDCQDFVKTVCKIETGKGLIHAALTGDAIVIRCWSKEGNPRWLPRHAVLWVRGKGWIDSTHRQWRRSPLPHFPIWPIGTPGIGFGAWQIGIEAGWWSGISASSLIMGLFS